MVTIVSGLIGGLLGAVLTGAVVSSVDDGHRPPAVVWAMYFGNGDPDRYRLQGTLVHLLYGAGAGAVFASFARSLSLDLTTVSSAVTWAVVWAAVLAVIAVGFWSTVAIGDDLDPRSLAELSAEHLAYGITLGVVAFYAAGV